MWTHGLLKDRKKALSWSLVDISKGNLAITYQKSFSFHRLVLTCLIIRSIQLHVTAEAGTWSWHVALFWACCCDFGPGSGWPHCRLYSHHPKAPIAPAPPVRDLKTISVSLASARLTLFLKSREVGRPRPVTGDPLWHFFHQACLKTSSPPRSSTHLSPLEVSCPKAPYFFMAQFSGHFGEE